MNQETLQKAKKLQDLIQHNKKILTQVNDFLNKDKSQLNKITIGYRTDPRGWTDDEIFLETREFGIFKTVEGVKDLLVEFAERYKEILTERDKKLTEEFNKL